MKLLSLLYITHNGIADHIGQSQVTPYLTGLARLGHRITLISLEKAEKKDTIDKLIPLLREANIEWHYLPYHRKPPILSTLWDVFCMMRLAGRLINKNKISLLHCRAYIPALIGLHFKKTRGTKFLFDMRGFWPDESVEVGRLNIERNLGHRMIYRFFKKKERMFLEQADHIVSLTEAGKSAIEEWTDNGSVKTKAPIGVIPCCADFNFFNIERLEKTKVKAVREKLGLRADDFVLIYLGSLGPSTQQPLYMVEQMLEFYKVLLTRRPNAKFLLVANNNHNIARDSAAHQGLNQSNLIITQADREEVPYLIAQSNLSVFFINPSPNRRACSPTKLAELFAMNVPVVTNTGIGDLDAILDLELNCSTVIEQFEKYEYEKKIDLVLNIAERQTTIRENSSSLSLLAGVSAYNRIYQQLGEVT